MEALCNFHSGRAAKEDIYTLEAIKFVLPFSFAAQPDNLWPRSLLDDRIRGIKEIIAHREGDADGFHSNASISMASTRQPTPATPPPGIQRRPASPPLVAAMTRPYEDTSYASTSTYTVSSTVGNGSFVSVQERTVQETFTPDPDPFDEDEALWADLDDVTMDYVDDHPVPEPEPPQELTGPYAAEIKSHLNSTFGLKTFRKNQFEAINAAMAGRDVFVLMPTGGGKSLCFQLPAVCRGGRTRGVTIVVSPLLALMHDQVNGLKEKNIDAVLLTSNTTEADARQIRDRVYSREKPTFLYVTPERLKVSASTKSMLSYLYRSKELARFVIDEAHCISTWGQDFREAVSVYFIILSSLLNGRAF
jgi:bloom syndrome protein